MSTFVTESSKATGVARIRDATRAMPRWPACRGLNEPGRMARGAGTPRASWPSGHDVSRSIEPASNGAKRVEATADALRRVGRPGRAGWRCRGGDPAGAGQRGDDRPRHDVLLGRAVAAILVQHDGRHVDPVAGGDGDVAAVLALLGPVADQARRRAEPHRGRRLRGERAAPARGPGAPSPWRSPRCTPGPARRPGTGRARCSRRARSPRRACASRRARAATRRSPRCRRR